MKAVVWDDEWLGATFHDEDIPADLMDLAKEYHDKLVEQAVELDEEAMEAYLEGKEVSEDKLKELIRKGTINLDFVPVLCGSAFKNKGVQPLLDAVVDYLPSPLDVPAIKAIDAKTDEEVSRPPSDDAPLSMLAFKIMNDPFVGSLTFCRIYSGKVETGKTPVQHGEGQEGAHRPHAAHALQSPRGHQGSLYRRHRRHRRPQGRDHRRHALRSPASR